MVGAGPAGLMAAEELARAGRRVIVHDASPSPARKFLLAGRGGLNLTHSEPLETFLTRYGAAAERLRPAIEAFPPEALSGWAATFGEETFVGTSGRVFPKSFKATPLLRAWLRRLGDLGVELKRARALSASAKTGLCASPGPRARRRHAGRGGVRARRRLLAAARFRRRLGPGVPGRRYRGRAAETRQLRLHRRWSARIREDFAGAPLKNVALALAAACACAAKRW